MELTSPGLILKYFPGITPAQVRQFGRFHELIVEWNEKINLVSRKDIEHLTEKHILHSLALARAIQFKPGTKVLDIGTGGGFPGVPLAIMFPGSEFHLVDSIGKKIMVVKEIIASLGLANAAAGQLRAETLKSSYDFATSRAVAPLPELVRWMKGKIIRKNFNTLANGLLCLKGGDLTEETAGIKNRTVIYNISDFFEESFFESKKLVFVQMN